MKKRTAGRTGILMAVILSGAGMRIQAVSADGIVRVTAGFDRMVADAGTTDPETERRYRTESGRKRQPEKRNRRPCRSRKSQ